jgi:heme oxygenase
VIARQAQRLGFSESFGARHLALQVRSSGNWRAFLALLETAQGFDADHATGAAIRAFRSAESAFGLSCP